MTHRKNNHKKREFSLFDRLGGWSPDTQSDIRMVTSRVRVHRDAANQAMLADESLPEGSEIRVTASGKERNYIGYASKLIEERELDTVVLTGMGSAITKTITVAEILKRRIPDLHQWTEIESREAQVLLRLLFN